MNKDYAKAFRIIRAAFGLKQSDLAERMPVTARQLSLIEAGKRQPSLRVVDAFASAVGVPSPLVALLASDFREVASYADANINDLARALLRMLVAAKQSVPKTLENCSKYIE